MTNLRQMSVFLAAAGLLAFNAEISANTPADVADRICACLAPEHAKLEEATEAFGNGDSYALLDATDMLPILKERSDRCTGEIAGQVADSDAGFKDAVIDIVDERCPRPSLPGGLHMGGVPLSGRTPVFK